MPESSTTRYPILLTCAREIPTYLERELIALGYPIKAVYPAGVETEGTLQDCVELNHRLRTAHRVLLRLGSWRALSPDAMYDAVYSIEWEHWIDREGYLSVISSVKTGSIDNTQFANVRCKDAIVDRIRDKRGSRPDAGPVASDSSVVFLYWHGDDCMVYADTSGHSLSDRGYRVHPGKAPLRESLAAAIVMGTNWQPDQPFVNPMCGSGTLAVEAALIAGNRAPGSFRRDFSYKHFLPFSGLAPTPVTEKPIECEIILSDHDERVVRSARENIRNARLDKFITIQSCDFRKTRTPVTEGGIVIMNPEYGLRLGNAQQLEGVYEEIGDYFKKECKGRTGYVFSGNLALLKHVGLRSSKRLPFWSADIECRLVEFQLYEGSKKKAAAESS